MLVIASTLIGRPVLSLHTGTPIARITDLIVDPNDLKIIAFRLEHLVTLDDAGDILPVDAIREFSQLGFIVDSADEFAADGDIIYLDKIIKLNFAIPGLKVQTKKGAKIGKVNDFTVEPEGWQLQQIVVTKPFFKALLSPELIISRKEIVEVNDYAIIIKDDKSKTKATADATPEFTPNFVNPFRDPELVASRDAIRVDEE